jgi:hypothetical protein
MLETMNLRIILLLAGILGLSACSSEFAEPKYGVGFGSLPYYQQMALTH